MAGYWSTSTSPERRSVDPVGVGLFFIVACIWSGLAAHLPALSLPERLSGFKIDNSILSGFGPAIGAGVAMLVRPQALPVRSFFGPMIGWSMLALAAPVLSCLALPALGSSKHEVLLPFAVSVLIYCVGEELGWRGWLFDALSPLPRWQSALTTALLWYMWHWTFFADQLINPKFGAGFAVGIVIASFGFAAAVNRTRATALAVAWHAASKLLIAPAQMLIMLAAIVCANVFGKARQSGQ